MKKPATRGERIRAARERKGLSRQQLATLVGCATTTIWNLEEGLTWTTKRVLEGVATALGSTLDEIQNGKPAPKKKARGRK